MMFKKTLIATALIAFGGFASTSMAAAPTFQVTMTINSACSVSTTGNVAFAAVSSTNTSDQTANAQTISVICSKGTAFKIGLQPTGTATDGTGLMSGTLSSDKIPYTLYSKSDFSTAWGNNGVSASSLGNGVAGTVSTDGTTASKYTVYAKVLGSNLNVTPDAYADTVTVDLYY